MISENADIIRRGRHNPADPGSGLIPIPVLSRNDRAGYRLIHFTRTDIPRTAAGKVYNIIYKSKIAVST